MAVRLRSVMKTRSSSSEALASPEVVAMLEDRLAALNSGDAKAASFYTRDAVLDDDAAGGIVTWGNAAIGAYIAGYVNSGVLRLESFGPIYRWGRTVAEAVRVPGNEGTDWLLLYRVQASGKISYQWILVASQYETDID